MPSKGLLSSGDACSEPAMEDETITEQFKDFLSRCFSTKQKFLREYKKLCNTKKKSQGFYRQILIELESSISEGKLCTFKKLCSFIDYLTDSEDPATLKDSSDNAETLVEGTNLVVLACQHNRVNILRYMLDGNCNTDLLLNNVNENCHNAFYYAIRSGNVELVETLVAKWPENYFTARIGSLDEIISKAYEELKLKNVQLTEEVEMFVESKLLVLRFFSNPPQQNLNPESLLSTLKERIDLVLQNIDLLKAKYSAKEVDDKFLFVAKFLAKNIHILKQLLKSTYIRLPWEEIEFCLVSFVSSKIKQQEINFVYNIILNKDKILKYLSNFAKKLAEENKIMEKVTDISEFAELPVLKREIVVSKIVSNCPEFGELYNDFQKVRDYYSMDKISEYLKLSLLTDAKEREGQLIITRALQMLSEYLKNTLESPNLSSVTNEFLLRILPVNTQELVIDLRNTQSGSDSLAKRIEIEDKNVDFFIGVQNDFKVLNSLVNALFELIKAKMVRVLLDKIAETEKIDDFKDIAAVVKDIDVYTMTKALNIGLIVEYEVVQKIFEELTKIPNKSTYELEIFRKVTKIIDWPKLQAAKFDIDEAISWFNSLCSLLRNHKIDNLNVNEVKYRARKMLQNLPLLITSDNLKRIAKLSRNLILVACLRDGFDASIVICKLFNFVGLEIGDFQWIDELKSTLNDRGSFLLKNVQSKHCSISPENYNSLLELKVTELKSIFEKYNIFDPELLPYHKNNKSLQAVVELFVLDVMTILSEMNKLQNNLYSFDDYSFVLAEYVLLQYLAHGNALVNVVLPNSFASVLLTTKEMVLGRVLTGKIGGKLLNGPSGLKQKFDQSLQNVCNQEDMFTALKEGNWEEFKSCLAKRADLLGRTFQFSDALHCAAIGSSLETFEFIIEQKIDVNDKDVIGKTCLHTASAYGRTDIVKYLIAEVGVNPNDTDENGKVPLALAAENGHKDTIEIFLKYYASTSIKDGAGVLPVYYAIRNGHIEAAKVLLDKETNVDINLNPAGLAPLHEAAHKGSLELVNFLLEKEANVNVRDNQGYVPLHLASINGHSDVVKTLLAKGADVNASTLQNSTPLYFAAKYGHKDVVEMLIRNRGKARAKADARDQDTDWDLSELHIAALSGNIDVNLLVKNKDVLNAKSNDGSTALHLASQHGHKDAVTALLKAKAEVNAQDMTNRTPLHLAIEMGHKDIVELLVKNNAKVSVSGTLPSALHAAVDNGNKDIAEILVNNGAKVNVHYLGLPAVELAIMLNRKDILELLIAKGVSVSESLFLAVKAGFKDIVEVVLKNKGRVHSKNSKDLTPLHAAAGRGLKEIVNVLIARGAIADARSPKGTPLFVAVEGGHDEVAEVLIANKANVNLSNGECVPLHIAAMWGHAKVVEVLLKNGAKMNVKNDDDMTPIDVAVQYEKVEVVKVFLRNDKKAKWKDSTLALLHSAAGGGKIEMVKTLVTAGFSISATDKNGLKPVHSAASKGHLDIVKLFLGEGLSVNETASGNQTLLHFAAVGHMDVAKFLISEGADVNAKDSNGLMPLHVAARFGLKDLMEVLLNNGAIYDETDKVLKATIAQSDNEDIPIFLQSTADIFEAVKRNNPSEVERYIKEGGVVNARTAGGGTFLHYAACQGFDKVIDVLLKHNANPNLIGSKKFTPLHYAAKFGHVKIARALLTHGAIYNAVSDTGKTPLDLADSEEIKKLLALVGKSFKHVEKKNSDDIFGPMFLILNSVDNIKAAMGARDEKNRTVIVSGIQNNYENVGMLKILSQPGVEAQIYEAKHEGTDEQSLRILVNVFEKRKLILGPNNPGTLDIQKKMANVLLKQGNYKEALKMLTELCQKFEEQLGPNYKKTLSTKNEMALSMYLMGKTEESLSIFREVCKKQEKILGTYHKDTLATLNNMTMALDLQDKFDEALSIYLKMFKHYKETLGVNSLKTLTAQNNIALILCRQHKFDESLKIYDIVYQKRKTILGVHHSETLNTLQNIGLTYSYAHKYDMAYKIYFEALEQFKIILPEDHPAILTFKFNIASAYFRDDKLIRSFKLYKEIFGNFLAVYGPTHSRVTFIATRLKTLTEKLARVGIDATTLQKRLDIAVNTGDVMILLRYLCYSDDFNVKDSDGRTPLHYAVNNGHIEIVHILLKNGASVTEVTNNGNTPLHTATAKSNKDMVDVLFKYVNPDKLSDFVNAKTLSGGATALQVAAKNGSVEIVKCLLAHGADSKIKNKQGKTAFDLCQDEKVRNLLKVPEDMLTDITDFFKIYKKN